MRNDNTNKSLPATNHYPKGGSVTKLKRLTATFSILLLGISMNADAALHEIRLTAITSNGLGSCHATFYLNPQPSTVDNINIRVGGLTSIEDPGSWRLLSPTNTNMPSTIFGFDVTTATHKWYEYNTSHHNGRLDRGTWELLFDEPPGGCAQYSASLTFDGDSALHEIRLTAITSNGLGSCHATFNLNPAQPYTVNNINIRVGGSTGIEDPGDWRLLSPTNTNMPLTIFGFNVTTATNKWYEYNTSHHDGPLDTGMWELLFDEPLGGCAQYSASLTFDAT